MNKLKRTTAFLLMLCLALGAVAVASADNFLVVPGRSVGKIRLGDARSTVIKSMGQPSQSAKWRSGLTQDTWLGPKPANNEDGLPVSERTFLHVIYRNSRVAQTEFNSPRFATASGISTHSSLAQFRAHHRNLRVRAYGYDDPGGGGYIGYYYDDVVKGIAFTFGVQDEFDARITPHALRVHSPGTPVIIDPGGKAEKAKDEIPVGRKEQ